MRDWYSSTMRTSMRSTSGKRWPSSALAMACASAGKAASAFASVWNTVGRKVGLACSTILSLRFHSFTMNGPVPTGWLPTCPGAAYASATSRATTAVAGMAR